ncbi:acetyl/propionyl/methylcrotonyl-CoA carboxylase subunit alpha [Nesterenkonia sp. HG001]|uniref:acetyl/propionyl/methylcrotonyl-CoA carboxylase subunit alpha n=1 Tax=Nesterenkonia sp. HG001 TaxID=2983207 RepID=UPI002AC4161A|nr:biotin carboxylase N-terminal domain-containing protein [Nesterenkonia sp. HG001]MDZ5076944.1 acetyl/propionyl-CoA carboxylase subunit alpha [Nesterenkonia sp. HG001]
MPQPPRTRPAPLFSTVLVANRGEIACRVIATLHRLGIASVAVHSEADADAAHVRLADRSVCLGPAAASASYLDIEAVIEATRVTGAEAIHPGYGFLSENPAFARACAEAGIVFIGPGVRALEIMGDKIRSKDHVAAAGVPLVEGVSAPGLGDDELVAAAAGMTYPALIKPSAGGGGKGMQVVERLEDLAAALPAARRVARSAFGDDSLMIEQLIRSPRHIEVQVLADDHGRVIHLGERECSLQRRHQKVIEEAPSPLLLDSPDGERLRAQLGEAACEAARSVDYRGAGTVEFLVSDAQPEKFFFMEMNTRLQVEHPVTEEITGVDLVEQQVRIAAGQPLELTQDDVVLTGHAIEARVYAETPEAGFMPSTGRILHLREPSGPGIRVDSGLREGSTVGVDYDPMLAKVIASGPNREQALARLHRALGETVVLGVQTNLAYLRGLLADEDVQAGRMDTTLIERRLPELEFPWPDDDVLTAAGLHLAGPQARPASGMGSGWTSDGWRLTEPAVPTVLVTYCSPGGEQLTATVQLDGTATLTPLPTGASTSGPGTHLLTRKTRCRPVALVRDGAEVWVWAQGLTVRLTVADRRAQTVTALAQREAELSEASPEVTAPLPGTVIAVEADTGTQVTTGDPLVTIEAMKMEHRMLAPFDGTVSIAVAAGDQVSLGQVLATVTKED